MSRRKTDQPFYLFHQGANFESYKVFGAFPTKQGRGSGYRFRVWAANANNVYVEYDGNEHLMSRISDEDIFEVFVPKVVAGESYRYVIEDKKGEKHYKADPYSHKAVMIGEDCYSVTTELSFEEEKEAPAPFKLDTPVNIYSVHLGSWKRDGDNKPLNYEKLGEELSQYASVMGYTHIHLLPVLEHFYKEGLGYSPSFFFAPTNMYGELEGFKRFVELCHEKSVGVIIDMPISSFPKELLNFDGSKLYETVVPNSKTASFDLSKPEVHSFILSVCSFWVEAFNIDGIRFDGVGRIIYPEFGRMGDRWRPSAFAEQDADGVKLLRKISTLMTEKHPNVITIAQDLSPLTSVTSSVKDGGFGFHFTMNSEMTGEVIDFISVPYNYKKMELDSLTYWLTADTKEKYVVGFDHSRFMYGKRSLLARTVGEDWEQYAILKAVATFFATLPGANITWMGNEFGHMPEWSFEKALDRSRMDLFQNQYLQVFSKELNLFALGEKALWEKNKITDVQIDEEHSVFSFRRGELLVAVNMSEDVCRNYNIEVNNEASFKEIFSTDNLMFGGKGAANRGKITAVSNNDKYNLTINIPSVGVTILKEED